MFYNIQILLKALFFHIYNYLCKKNDMIKEKVTFELLTFFWNNSTNKQKEHGLVKYFVSKNLDKSNIELSKLLAEKKDLTGKFNVLVNTDTISKIRNKL